MSGRRATRRLATPSTATASRETERAPTARRGMAVIALIVAVGSVLAWLAVRVRIAGDASIEGAFFERHWGGSVLIQRGDVDPIRYLEYGPLFDVLLALVGIAIDPFVFAKLISVACAVGVLGLTWQLWRMHGDAIVAALAVGLLVIHPAFLSAATAATHEMLSAVLILGALVSLDRWHGRTAGLIAGILTGLAFLASYSTLAFVVALVVSLRGRPESIRASAIGFTAGSLVVVLAGALWLAVAGRPSEPGVAFKLSWLISITENVWPRIIERVAAMTWPLIVVAGLGFVLARRRRWHPDRARLIAVAVALLVLRWGADEGGRASVAALAVACGFAGLGITALGRRPIPHLRTVVPIVAAIMVFGWVGAQGVARVMDDRRRQPVEVVEAARVVSREAPSPAVAMSNFPQFAYHARRLTVPLPKFDSIGELAARCRRRGVGYLHVNAEDCLKHRKGAWLLDSTVAVPGLDPIHRSSGRLSATFRIGPEFGRTPDWFAADPNGEVRNARMLLEVLPDSAKWTPYLVLAEDALNRGDSGTAIRHALIALDIRPDHSLGWVIVAESQRAQGRDEAAKRSYASALDVDARDVDARLGLGLLEWIDGNASRAAQLWRPALVETNDPALLEQMRRAFEQVGDPVAAHAAADLRRRFEP